MPALWHTECVTDVAAFVDRAWRDGIGPDDEHQLRSLLAAGADDPAVPELRMFGAWFELMNQIRVDVPPPPIGVAAIVVTRSATLERARLARDPAEIDAAVEQLTRAVETLEDTDPHALAARAWADLAIGKLAAMLGDGPTARRRFESMTASGNPLALRVGAMLELAAQALSRVNIDPARTWARRALTLAEHGGRFAHATRARMLLGMLEYAAGDLAAMRRILRPHADVTPLARILLANFESAGRAMPLLGEGLRVATENGDSLGYLLCILIGARRYAAIGRDADALITLSAGIAQLQPIAPQLAGVLVEERLSWLKDWGEDRFGRAEASALEVLDRDS